VQREAGDREMSADDGENGLPRPVTELDPRFSEPDAVATSWEETQAVLESAQLMWLSTVRGGGHPHVTPVVGVWLDGAIYFSTGGGEQKAVNLFRNPNVALTVAGGHWDQGLDVVVEGTAFRVTDAQALERAASAWATKWDGRWQWGVGDGVFVDDHGEALVFAVHPSKVLAFSQGHFSHTRHRF
jgi:nitroimidazol reductase NimA-like FMN-containing flavoprotein (pyridoxamine 5'-phosphate oxidase superfamily)